MGKQSARIYFQGKDHKEIYYQGHYHKAMYIGNQLVWEKLTEEKKELNFVQSIIYRNGLYVVFSSSGIFVGNDLNNMKFLYDNFRKIVGNSLGSIYCKLTNEEYVLINTAKMYFDTFLITDNKLSVESYLHNSTLYPIMADVHKDGIDSDVGTVIIKDKYFYPNNVYYKDKDNGYFAGFNKKEYDVDVNDHIGDAFLKDNIAWGIAYEIHGGKSLKYIYQNFYSIDYDENIKKIELRFPEEMTTAIRVKALKYACEEYSYCDEHAVYGDEESSDGRLTSYNSLSPEHEYIINNKLYRYSYISIPIAGIITSTAGTHISNFNSYFNCVIYYKVDLKTLTITEFEITEEAPTWKNPPKWGLPMANTIISKYETSDFTLYCIDYGTAYIIYNLTSEGDKTHTIYFKDFENDEDGIVKKLYEDGIHFSYRSAYLQNNYIYINYSKTKRIRINIKTNTGDIIDQPKVYYAEE